MKIKKLSGHEGMQWDANNKFWLHFSKYDFKIIKSLYSVHDLQISFH